MKNTMTVLTTQAVAFIHPKSLWVALLLAITGCNAEKNVVCPAEVTDAGNNTYRVVKIGAQCWTASNVRTKVYNNGDTIPDTLTGPTWSAATTGARDRYVESGQPLNDTVFGLHYNWFAVDDARGICPTGWHVPSDEEWGTLDDELGGSPLSGPALKDSVGWFRGLKGLNSQGFSARPAGYRGLLQSFFQPNPFLDYGFTAAWWSSTTDPRSDAGADAWYRKLDVYRDGLVRLSPDKNLGFSVRCVKDVE
jgi:uncharacterized protein (TIGR02145 family)